VDQFEFAENISEPQLPVVRKQWFESFVNDFRPGCKTKVSDTEGAEVLIIRLFDEFHYYIQIRLNLEHLQDEAQELCWPATATVCSSYVLQLDSLVYEGFRGKRETMLFPISIIVDF
jgi:hypothetical protein